MRRCFACSVAVLVLAASAPAAEKSLPKESLTFGTLSAPSEVSVRAQAAQWLKEQGAYSRAAFDAIWAKQEPVLDRLSATFSLGDKAAAQLLKDARKADAAAPTALPAVLGDAKKPVFFRANLALAYAKGLTNRKVYEEALQTLALFKADQVIDPASFLFHKAVAEHGLMLKRDADESIARLLDDVPTAPERYKIVAALMHFDMVNWSDKDLAAIARKMDLVQRRLDLVRGGKKTQTIQKEIVARLDELIKELENQNDPDSQNGGGSSPGGKQNGKSGSKPSNNIRSTSPQQDSMPGNGSGPGEVDKQKIEELAKVWGKLPQREREANIRELTRTMPPRYAEVIREYFRRLSEQADAGN
jgi:hypothetical protein